MPRLLPVKIGDAIFRTRGTVGLTQTDLAAASGLSLKTVQNAERNCGSSPRAARKIADALHTTLDGLVALQSQIEQAGDPAAIKPAA